MQRCCSQSDKCVKDVDVKTAIQRDRLMLIKTDNSILPSYKCSELTVADKAQKLRTVFPIVCFGPTVMSSFPPEPSRIDMLCRRQTGMATTLSHSQRLTASNQQLDGYSLLFNGQTLEAQQCSSCSHQLSALFALKNARKPTKSHTVT